ncbi:MULTISPECIES: FAD-dependent oxidoreductase [Paenibacillus]|uniref:Pyridine nucleotide-disulfide oxidoreductase n=1 Tax=Paenibacillus odorifer TaxID=189426 RepID=A0ABX3H7H1_9BACL|nr:FAD-dependent oxidoreductase [Paenibacillus odorifer]OMD45966.1 pyridine nucleotide-disulfide oxidoreductase [Paenibacillus odorifer]
MREETIQIDITVVGGGLAGVNAAIAAARLGRTVALVHNRPVLGGNSSSEVRVWVCGATAHGKHRNARETGIMGELFIENQFCNPDGNPYIWDLVVMEAVKAEPNIRLFLNTDVHEVEAEGEADQRRICSVTGWMMGSERKIRLKSEIYLDCTGDGLIGFLAGAQYRLGREAHNEYGEAWAPENADDITLGSTILFYTKDAGHPVKYVPPSFAKDILQTTIPITRVIRSGDSGCDYWWVEWGGELDTVHENERIRDELWSVIYGIWDYIKNSGKFDSENMTLEWIGALPGKREYRRFIGDYVLNQNDIIAQRRFEDSVTFGGWSIDLHPPQGMYSIESGSKHWHMDGSYHIPFRSLYSINVSNLMFAGRNVSATHIAFGTTRVMATCAVMGEAAGTGAAIAVQHGGSPRDVYEIHLEELSQTLLRQDASVLGIVNHDDRDQAQRATICASSTRVRLAAENPSDKFALETDAGLLLPVNPELSELELLLDSAGDTKLTVEVWSTGSPQNYVPIQLETSATVSVSAGEAQWVSFPLSWKPGTPRNAFIIIKSNSCITLRVDDRYETGVLSFRKNDGVMETNTLTDQQEDQLLVMWRTNGLERKTFCFRAFPEIEAYSAYKAIDGYRRPYDGPHAWKSEELSCGEEACLELSWTDRPVELNQVHIVFNDDVNEDLINLHHHRTPFDTIPELVRDYRLEAFSEGKWTVLHREKGNYKRKRIHRLPAPVKASALRLVVEASNGGRFAEVVEVRVYS